jgi:hypothetical protein
MHSATRGAVKTRITVSRAHHSKLKTGDRLRDSALGRSEEDTAAIHFELICRSAHDALLVSFRALLPLCANLPGSGGQVLVTDLNCSESREGRTAPASYRLAPGLRPEAGQLAAVARQGDADGSRRLAHVSYLFDFWSLRDQASTSRRQWTGLVGAAKH